MKLMTATARIPFLCLRCLAAFLLLLVLGCPRSNKVRVDFRPIKRTIPVGGSTELTWKLTCGSKATCPQTVTIQPGIGEIRVSSDRSGVRQVSPSETQTYTF